MKKFLALILVASLASNVSAQVPVIEVPVIEVPVIDAAEQVEILKLAQETVKELTEAGKTPEEIVQIVEAGLTSSSIKNDRVNFFVLGIVATVAAYGVFKGGQWLYNNLTTKKAPVNENPVNENPVNENPVNENPVNENPVNENPVNENPVN